MSAMRVSSIALLPKGRDFEHPSPSPECSPVFDNAIHKIQYCFLLILFFFSILFGICEVQNAVIMIIE